MQIPLPANVKIKDQDYKTESLSDPAKRILADVIAAEAEITRTAALLRLFEISRKELISMLETEVSSPK